MSDRRQPRSGSTGDSATDRAASRLMTAADVSGAGQTPSDGSGLPHQRGMTLVQLTALYLIRARALITLTDLTRALGTDRPIVSAMVEGFVHAGLVWRWANRCHCGQVVVTLTPTGKTLIDDSGPDTATRLWTVLNQTSAVSQPVSVWSGAGRCRSCG